MFDAKERRAVCISNDADKAGVRFYEQSYPNYAEVPL